MTALQDRAVELAAATATVRSSEFARAVGNAALFAAKDECRPVMTCVRLTFGAGRLVAAASNDYYLAEDSAVTEEGAGLDGTWLVPVSGLEPILKAARKDRHGFVLLTIGRAALVAKFPMLGTEYIVEHRPGTDYPKIEQLWPATPPSLDGARIQISPALLATYAKVNTGYTPSRNKRGEKVGDPCRFTFHTTDKAILIELGSTFRSLLMPVRTK